MKVKIVLDTRHQNKNGLYPIKLSISEKGSTSLLPLNIEVAKNQWDTKAEKIVKHPNAGQLNMVIMRTKLDVDSFTLGTNTRGKTATQIKDMILAHLYPEQKSTNILNLYREFMDTKTGSTKLGYQTALHSFMRLIPNFDKLNLEDIDKAWLMKYNDLLVSSGLKMNTRFGYFRKLKSFYNYAIDMELTTNDPFRKFKMKAPEPAKRPMGVEQLRTIFNYPSHEGYALGQDVFKLIFFLIGINVKDLCSLTEIVNGRIEYDRYKTGKHYSIKVEPEALEIINKYRGDKYLLNMLEQYETYQYFNSKVNKELKRIGEAKEVRYGRGNGKIRYDFTPIFPKLSTYYARHAWATIAVNDLDAPFDLVSKALGHSATTGALVTSVYVDFNMRKVDELNRRMIDWVLYGKK